MKSNEWLYGKGITPEPIPEYVIMRRVESLDDHLTELQATPLPYRNWSRVKEVQDAIEWWSTLNSNKEVYHEED